MHSNTLDSLTREEIAEHLTAVFDSINEFWELTDDTSVTEEIIAFDGLYRLATCSLEEMMQVFRHYRLFAVRYLDDLTIMISRLPFGEFKAYMVQVLYEELGLKTSEGYENNIVNLLDKFLASLGASPEIYLDRSLEVTKNVALLDDLSKSLNSKSMYYAIGLRGVGTECLCQVYLAAMFELCEQNPYFQNMQDSLDPRFLERYLRPNEPQHRIKLRDWIADLILVDPNGLSELKQGLEEARVSFHQFFDNIYHHIDNIDKESSLD